MSAWNKGPASSSWADDAEKDDTDVSDIPVVAAPPLPKEDDAFPSLSAASAQPSRKKEKAKKQTVSLSEFTSGTYVGPGGRSRLIVDSHKGLTAQEMAMLPTGPRERAPDEEEGPGFRGYGGSRGGDRFGDRKDRDRDDREGGERGGRQREMDMPSREDSSSSWGADRKFVPTSDRGGRFGGGFRDDERSGDREGPSKADEVDDWGSGKKFAPSSGGAGSTWGGRGGGGGFEDRGRRGGGFDAPRSPPGSRADEVDNWGSQKKFTPTSASVSREGAGWGRRDGPSAADEGDRWGKGRRADSAAEEADRWGKRTESAAGADSRAPGERPRLVLQKRTVPLDSAPAPAPAPAPPSGGAHADEPNPPRAQQPKGDPFGGAKPREVVLTEKGVKPGGDLDRTSSTGSVSSTASDRERMGNGHAATGPAVAKPKPNPFGEAKPREVLLQERGEDWRKKDAEAEGKKAAGGRPEVDAGEERRLKEEIGALQGKLQDASLEEGGEKEQLEKELQEKQARLQGLGSSGPGGGGYAGALKSAWRTPAAAQPTEQSQVEGESRAQAANGEASVSEKPGGRW